MPVRRPVLVPQLKMSSPGRISANLTRGGAIENKWEKSERGEKEEKREDLIMSQPHT